MIAPCSVKTFGRWGENRRFARWSQSATTLSFSSSVSWKAKSSGNLSRLRFTCSFSRLVSTPYRSARSASRMTLCPRIDRIRARRVQSEQAYRSIRISKDLVILRSQNVIPRRLAHRAKDMVSRLLLFSWITRCSGATSPPSPRLARLARMACLSRQGRGCKWSDALLLPSSRRYASINSNVRGLGVCNGLYLRSSYSCQNRVARNYLLTVLGRSIPRGHPLPNPPPSQRGRGQSPLSRQGRGGAISRSMIRRDLAYGLTPASMDPWGGAR